jgi:hypothetical protein
VASLRARIVRIERRRNELLDRLALLREEHLAATPIEGKWSILEIVEHLVPSERDVMPGISDPSDLASRLRTLKDRILFLLVMVLLRFPIPVRTPSKGMVPRGKKSLGELRDMWDQNHQWLKSFFDGLGRESLRRPVLAHPVAGPLTPGQAVWMLEVHLVRHLKQIRGRRLVRSGCQPIDSPGPPDIVQADTWSTTECRSPCS